LWAEMIACCTRCKDTPLAVKVFNEWKVMREARGMEGGVIVLEAMIAHYTAKNDPEVKREKKMTFCLNLIRNEFCNLTQMLLNLIVCFLYYLFVFDFNLVIALFCLVDSLVLLLFIEFYLLCLFCRLLNFNFFLVSSL
jgi:hypothetical protein